MHILQIAVNLETDFYENHKNGLNEGNRQLCGRLNQTTTLTSIEDTLLQLPYANLLCGFQTESQICFPIFINSVMLWSLLDQRRIIEYSDRKVDLALVTVLLSSHILFPSNEVFPPLHHSHSPPHSRVCRTFSSFHHGSQSWRTYRLSHAWTPTSRPEVEQFSGNDFIQLLQ